MPLRVPLALKHSAQLGGANARNREAASSCGVVTRDPCPCIKKQVSKVALVPRRVVCRNWASMDLINALGAVYHTGCDRVASLPPEALCEHTACQASPYPMSQGCGGARASVCHGSQVPALGQPRSPLDSSPTANTSVVDEGFSPCGHHLCPPL